MRQEGGSDLRFAAGLVALLPDVPALVAALLLSPFPSPPAPPNPLASSGVRRNFVPAHRWITTHTSLAQAHAEASLSQFGPRSRIENASVWKEAEEKEEGPRRAGQEEREEKEEKEERKTTHENN